MQQEPVSARSTGPQQDPALPPTPTMPPPEPPFEDHQPSPSPSPTEQATQEEFQFLRCQGCRAEAKCPKLLPCLHTLCSGCLEAPCMQCPICQVPQPPGDDMPILDNIFFESLQRRLLVHQQIMDARASCTRCKESADFWCFECEQLLCTTCFQAHQWFLKHEARPLAELRSQSVQEFLDGTRKSNNIFCSNPNHRTPALTSIYCRGCSKPLCCSCALLDSGHSELKCDISTEIQQRQEELNAMTQALQGLEGAFGVAQAQMLSAVRQLGRARADTEELIHSRVRQVVAHVLAQERELLEGVNARYQRDYEEMAGRLGRLDAVLQRIRTGVALVQRMQRYASDQEVLDMHGFLRQALQRLRQEEPQNLQVAVGTEGFDEFKECLQDLISYITQGTGGALLRRVSPETTSNAMGHFEVDLPEEVQRSQAQTPRLAEVQPEPGAHPVPVYAFSIKDPTSREEVSCTPPLRKRKACQTDSPRKSIKMESDKEKEARLAWSSPEQPRPSTSKAVSPPRLDEPPSPGSPTVGDEGVLPTSNHKTGDPGKAEDPIVISGSEDSDTENSHTEPLKTTEPHSSTAHPLLRARGASCLHPASHLARGTCGPPAGPPHRPASQATTPDARSPSQPAGPQEHVAVHRGIFPSHRAASVSRLHQILHLPGSVFGTPTRTHMLHAAQATTPATTGSPALPAGPQPPALLDRTSYWLCGRRRAARARGRPFRGASVLARLISRVASQLGASPRGAERAGEAPCTPGAAVSPGDSGRAPMENPQV
ncbi:protein PML isoform X2 [Dasypus novemcinctus]|uniref:protein PML isoform X2 n=1 Tax=Dasypus novemcinctus TaxID=9361 RepID=UPI00032917B7|nr:protein PML isoform X2 [Dasypus novemcinctus]